MRGRYNDILEADRHYIPLATDLSDSATAIERFSDPAERQHVADTAYELVQECHTYSHRLAAVQKAVSWR